MTGKLVNIPMDKRNYDRYYGGMNETMTGILFDYTENGMTVAQLEEQYHFNQKSIREFLRKEGVLRKRGGFRPTVTFAGMRRCARCKEERPLDDLSQESTPGVRWGY